MVKRTPTETRKVRIIRLRCYISAAAIEHAESLLNATVELIRFDGLIKVRANKAQDRKSIRIDISYDTQTYFWGRSHSLAG